MKKLILFVCILCTQITKGQSFGDFFTEGALRVDFYLTGAKHQTQVTIARLKKEPHFGGSKTNLIFPLYGTSYVRIKDKVTGQTIYGKGMSPIFYEWQDLEIPKQKNQLFENVIQIPYPKNDIIFEFLERENNGTLRLIYSEEIKMDSYQIIKETPEKYSVTPIYQNGSSEKAVDLAIVAEGYTQEEMSKFLADAKRLVDYMFTIAPFDKYKKIFNVYAIQSPSQESGTDVGGKGIYKNTILNSHFYTFGSERYLTSPSVFKLADILANVPYDQSYVLVNTPLYGGGGFYNVMNLASADGIYNDKVFVHEFGHGFVGLADEYFYENVIFADAKSLEYLQHEPWEQNITTLVHFDQKWADMVEKKIPIPTPRIPKYKDKVGVFEGGGYFTKGVYSPVQDCRMKSNNVEGFCPVCTRTIERTIQFFLN